MIDLIKLSTFAFLATALTALPAHAQATKTNKPPVDAKASTEKKPHPIHGKLAAINKSANSITVGKTPYFLNAETKITKGGKPASLEQAVIGEDVSGYVKPGSDGKLFASTLHLSPKLDAKKKQKEK
jgi:hypothetical protein